MLFLFGVFLFFAGLYTFGKCVRGNIYWRKYPSWYHHQVTFVGETIAGNRTTYDLVVFYRVVDWRAFRKARMADDSARDAFVRTVHDRVFRPAFDRRFFFSFLAEFPDRPWLIEYREGGEQVRLNFGNPHWLTSPEFTQHPPICGCVTHAVSIQIDRVDPTSVEENERHMDPKTRARILSDHEDLRFVEARCVYAQREHIEGLRLSHAWRVHGDGSPLEIRVRAVEDAVEIHWKKRSHEKWRVAAYREEVGFDSKTNRVEIVDSFARSDYLLEPLQEGRTYYVTFGVSRAVAAGLFVTRHEIEHVPPIRFSVAVPLSSLSKSKHEAQHRTAAADAFADEEATKRRWRRERGDAEGTEARKARYESSIAFEALKERIKRSVAAGDLVDRYRLLKKEILAAQELKVQGEISDEDFDGLVEDIKSIFEG